MGNSNGNLNDVNHVLFVIAMESEAQPFITAMSLQPLSNEIESPCQIFSGLRNGKKVSVVINGKSSRFGVDNVGTSAATLSTFLAINQLKPDLVISAGTAGGFRRKGASIGDVFVSTKVAFHDRRIPIPGFTEYGIGDYASLAVPQLVKVR
jgi:nucleoside phosphorylase